ncbi:hypothetical protein GCM10020367_63790 [Streptomyces sannanensis]|uniref:Uncharacterized protein n=1 Tax=Streptomyces sannanensis TaxID=285536 RepID=A0ABP6SM96_9ACTN
MAKVKAFIVHDTASGRIISIGRPVGGVKAVPIAGDGKSVLETEVEESDIDDMVGGKYRVDTERNSIVDI